ncbi:YitT family protein [Alistipes sp. An66]|uniref:YitT family protein n=1 Tax=Alistipes sp. An66 TaxID=1965650 RepID=UPI000B370E2C|nr:YitT family protein [Alistipes sp. An66]OUN58673.1 membrane protein [Alistipes sp. An66]
MNTRALLEPMGSWAWWRSWFLIFFGCSVMGAGFVLFINPYNFVPGGVYGMGIVLHNIFPSIQVGTFGYMFDIPLMLIAMLVFGGGFGTRTVLAALYTPGFMNILTRLVYPTPEAVESLDPSLMLGGRLDLSNDLLLTCIIGAVVVGVGQGIVVRQQATTGGTDIVGMLLQKFAGIKFSTGILLADGFVVLSGLVVIGFGLGTGEAAANGWMLTLYSLITIYVTSRVIAYLLDGASYDKLLFIISDHHAEIKRFIIEDMERGATYLKGKGMFTDRDREVIFLVISRKEVHLVQNRIREIDPQAFVVVTDAYETFGEGFKQFPDKNQIQAE